MFKLKSANPDPVELKRHACLNAVFYINVVFILYYLYRLNTTYNLHYFNIVLIPLYVLFLFTPLIYFRRKNFSFAALWALCLSGSIVTFLLLASGGLNAPGTFWLAAYPFLGGILLGRKGALAGSLMLAVSLVFLGVFGYLNLVPTIIFENLQFQAERVFNLITFSVYNILMTLFFIRTEEQHFKLQSEQKAEIENLLRILIHDVNNPMTVLDFNYTKIKTLIESQAEIDRAPYEKPLVRIQSSIKSILSILTQIRSMSVLKDGKISLGHNPVNLNKLLESTIDQQRGWCEEKGVGLTLHLPDACIEILADEVILQSVAITNLLTNAIKFTPKGKSVAVKLAVENFLVHIFVKDSGVGIPESILKDMFFFGRKTNRAGTAGEKGTGYGMPLMKSYVEKMGGQVKITSKESSEDLVNHGTEVLLTFPIYIRKTGVSGAKKVA